MVLNWICILERIPEIFHSWEKNVEWDVPKISVERHVEFYGCCAEPYPDIAFSIHLTRKPSYYITNIIVPSLIITVLVVLGFILPVSSGEKVSLEITVILAISVFLLLVADKWPPSADSTPLIGMVMLSVVFVCLFIVCLKATFNNIWRSVLLVEEAGGLGENLRSVAIHWQTLSHNVVHLALIEIRPRTISDDCIGSCKSNYYTITATTAHVISCNVKKAETIIRLKTKNTKTSEQFLIYYR